MYQRGGGVQGDFFTLMQSLAPDLAEEMCRRALVLERIAALQPVGRRQLATRLNMPEREVRGLASALKNDGFINLDASGMTLTAKADNVLSGAREFSRAMRGLTALETTLSELTGIPRVFIAAGDADIESHVLSDVGRIAAQRVRGILQNGYTIAVTGGNTISQVARFMPSATSLNVMVVPARGGMGRTVETQANTLVAEIARKLGGHHRLMHLPDHMDAAALSEMLKLPEIRETKELLQKADVLIHGIGRADVMARHRNLSPQLAQKLIAQGAVAEAFGYFFDKGGNCLYVASSVGVDLKTLNRECQMIAVSAGKHKAEAMTAILTHFKHEMLVTDEAAAKEMIRLLDK